MVELIDLPKMIHCFLLCATVFIKIFASKDTAEQNKVVTAEKMAASGGVFMLISIEKT
jgi:hypothetical protein